VIQISEEEVEQKGLALAEGAGDGDDDDGALAHILAQQQCRQRLLVQHERVLRRYHHLDAAPGFEAAVFTY
jgi:hypothetical protein